MVTHKHLEMCGKAQRDSPVLVLLAPPGEYNWMITQLSSCSREHGSNDCAVQIQQTTTTQEVCQSSYFKLFLYSPHRQQMLNEWSQSTARSCLTSTVVTSSQLTELRTSAAW